MGRITVKGVDIKMVLTPVTGTIIRVSVYPASETATPAERFDAPDLQPRDWPEPAAVLTETDQRDMQVGGFTVSAVGYPTILTVARGGTAVRSCAEMLPVDPMEKYTAPSGPTATLLSTCE